MGVVTVKSPGSPRLFARNRITGYRCAVPHVHVRSPPFLFFRGTPFGLEWDFFTGPAAALMRDPAYIPLRRPSLSVCVADLVICSAGLVCSLPRHDDALSTRFAASRSLRRLFAFLRNYAISPGLSVLLHLRSPVRYSWFFRARFGRAC